MGHFERGGRSRDVAVEWTRPTEAARRSTTYLIALSLLRRCFGSNQTLLLLLLLGCRAALWRDWCDIGMMSNPAVRFCNACFSFRNRLSRRLCCGPASPLALPIGEVGPRILCAVFDFDDTLVQSETGKRQIMFDMAREEAGEDGERLMEGAMRVGRNRFAIWKEFVRLRGLGDGPRLAKLYGDRVLNFVGSCEEVPGASDGLHQLRELGLELFVNSATPHESLIAILERRGGEWFWPWDQGGFFRFVKGSGKGGGSKVDNLRAAAAAAGATPLQVVMVGDGDNDWQAAKTYGCRFVGIDAGHMAKAAEAEVFCRDMAGASTAIACLARGEAPHSCALVRPRYLLDATLRSER